jgi:hypothetical protein
MNDERRRRREEREERKKKNLKIKKYKILLYCIVV